LLRGPREGMAVRIGGWSFERLIATFVLWAVVVTVGFAAWTMLPDPSDAEDESAPAPSIVIISTEHSAWSDPATAPIPATLTSSAEATAPAGSAGPASTATAPETRAEKAPIDGLRIFAQSWRRGGLGSKALVTLTLRNANDYPVKDIEIACAFSRRDGRHLTDRKRVIGDTISMKSRKTYAGMLVGFVNINANKAKCSLVTASRI
jgi:hypothetical protein